MNREKKILIIFFICSVILILTPLKFIPYFFLVIGLYSFKLKIIHKLFRKEFLFFSITQVLFRLLYETTLQDKIIYSIYAVFYVNSLLLLLLILFEKMKIRDIEEGMKQLNIPKKIIHMLTIALNSLFFFKDRVKKIYKIQKIRGTLSFFSIIIPILNSIFDRSWKISKSLTIRGIDLDSD